MKYLAIAVGLVMLLTGHRGPDRAQSAPCQAPAPPASKQPNIFSESQENDLGDAVAEMMAPDIRIIENEDVNATLAGIGGRLVRHLPPTKFNIRFLVVDLPDANAFVLPGGRVYVSRKLIGFTQSADELAGVLGHELGHLVARQQTLRYTRLLKDVLGVTTVTNRQDVFDKFNRLMDNAGRKPHAFDMHESREEGDQLEADRIGLYVVAAAGYDPQAHVQLWDRFSETKGRTGGFFSDLFGLTSPESKRLREMMKGAAAIQPGCVESGAAIDRNAYQQWQATAMGYVGALRKENVHNVVSRTTLAPALRQESVELRFSRDGRYVLAQDDGGISVLTREPFAPLFHIETTEAVEPQFSPDSSAVVFRTESLRVERWSIAARKLVEVHEVVVRAECIEARLAPDGKTLGCLDGNLNLNLIEVASGLPVWQVKKFYTADPYVGLVRSIMLGRTRLTHMGFSTDARFFAASFHVDGFIGRIPNREAAAVYDLQTRSAVEPKGNAKGLMVDGFVFTGPDQLVAFNQSNATRSLRVRLPEFSAAGEVTLYRGSATPAAKGDFVLVRPFQNDDVGVLDLAHNAVVKTSISSALDVYDDVYITERVSGELALCRLKDGSTVAAITLPGATLGRLDAAAVSPDFKWLAISGPARGAVWDLATGTRLLHAPAFRGGFFDDRGWLFADFRKTVDEARRLGQFDPQARKFTRLLDLVDDHIDQAGPVLMARAPMPREGLALQARDVRDSKPLWSATYTPEVPDFFPSDRSGTMVLAWPASSRMAREEAKKAPALARQLAALKATKGDYFVQVIDTASGAVKGALLIETGQASFEIANATAAGDWLAIEDTSNRVLIYSLSAGEQKGHVFGNRALIAPESGLLKVTNGETAVAIYELATMQRRGDFTFVQPVVLTSFNRDGRQLFVLTADQIAFTIDIAKR